MSRTSLTLLYAMLFAQFGDLQAHYLKNMHIGEAIKHELERQGKTVVWFAEQLPCDRTNAYRLFRKKSIDTHILIRISHILNHDFFSDYSTELNKKDCSK